MNDANFVLETIGLGRDFAGRYAVEDVSLTVEKGNILALLGPNGVGKTTVMKLIAGLLMPSRGHAQIWGQPCRPVSTEMRRVACVLDGMSPPADVRVQEILNLKNCVTETFDRAFAASLCKAHRIDLSKRWHSLSKGQKRWVLLAAALASHAELLLLDEPADGLDVATRHELYGLLRQQANQRQTTVVVASHIITDVERIADDVAILADGRVRLHSPLEQLRDEICEVCLHPDVEISDITPLAEIISSQRTDDGIIAVIRFRSQHLAEQTVPGESHRRRISLEEMYLAYTQPHQTVERSDAIVA